MGKINENEKVLTQQENLLVLVDWMALFWALYKGVGCIFSWVYELFYLIRELFITWIYNTFQMYTQYVNGYDKAMSVFQDTMKENSEFANLVSQFQVRDIH